ncbi:MAG: DUF917 domain-containing protein [Caldilineaceae bacterium]|nr:DUF917 domain-containing protein [Caldilineaceae bacterium]
MRRLTEQNIEDLALGAAVLGTGGGGDPYIGMLMARQAIRDYGPVELYTLDELNDDDLIVPTAMMGAPTVMVEKMPNGDDIVNAFQAVGKYIGKPIRATMSIEAGGMNSVVPIYVAARLRLPMVDCDGMGRAFPELQMVTHTIHGIDATPMAMSDERGNTVLMETINNRWTERFARSVTVDMGAMAMVALYAATVKQLKECAVIGTMTKAEEIGKTIRAARVNEADPVTTGREHVGGFLVFKGKIGDVQRRTEAGFAKGDAFLDGIDEYGGQKLRISFQNEHLVAKVDGEIKVSVPDLITVLDIDTGEPITTEAMRYGYRVAVIGIPCAHQWRSEAGLALAGPKYFGYNVEYVPVEQRYR